MTRDEEVRELQRLFGQERLTIDVTRPDRTCFLSHLGAQDRLVASPWIAHRDLIYSLALANLSPPQRESLARALLVEYDREFGIGHLRLRALPSGLPMGGSSLLLESRVQGLRCIYTWSVGPQAQAAPCDWLLLRAQPEWALPHPGQPLRPTGLATLEALGGQVLVLATSITDAVSIARHCISEVPMHAHPRYSPHIDDPHAEASVLLWPVDALSRVTLREESFAAIAAVGIPETDAERIRRFAADHGRAGQPIEVVDCPCPGRCDRPELLEFWSRCGRPKIWLRGDPVWAASGARWLQDEGAEVHVQGDATQLDLL